MSRSDVVRRLRALASKGVPMTVRQLLPAHAQLVGQALASFGGFDRARAIAGLEAPPIDSDPELLIAALRGLARSGVRLDVTTLATMGEAALVTACVDAFGSVPAAIARAGLGAPPEVVKPPVVVEGRREAGFAQPAISADGNVPTAQALEVLQRTAVSLGRVPAARDLPPDVARRLTADYGSVRFAYLALRVHSESSATTATSAAAPMASVSEEAIAKTARLPGDAGQSRRNVEAARAQPPAEVALDDAEVEALFAELDARIDEGAAVAAAHLRDTLTAALETFVDEVTELARRHTLESLLPFTTVEDDDDEDEEEDDEPERASEPLATQPEESA